MSHQARTLITPTPPCLRLMASTPAVDIRGDMLELWGSRGPPLWSVREHLPAGVTASMHNTATGTEIVFTPHQLVG
jgi:hypothetical protein